MSSINSRNPQRIFKKAYIKGKKLVKYSKRKFFAGQAQAIKLKKGEIPIVSVDAMGGDHAPSEIVKGCVRAAKELGIKVLIVGPQDIIKKELKKYDTEGLPLEIVHCDDYISMDEKNPANAVRRKKNSSIMVTMKQVAEGKAHAAVAAGSTGAAASAALFSLKRIAGIERPAIACLIPTPEKEILLLDAGANADSSPFQIAQHAIMGSVFAKHALNTSNPDVGLLNIGEEPGKGNKLSKETYDILEHLDSINFVGNVEGKVIYKADADVVVCDGFTGNVVLKTIEGSMKMCFSMLGEELRRDLNTKLGALACKPAFKRLKNDRLNPDKYGGAVLLGVGGVVIIAHGSSNDFAIMNAIRLGAETAKANVISQIQELINTDEILEAK